MSQEGFLAVLFEQLGNLGIERGKGVTSITGGVLMVLRSYDERKKLEALAKLSGQEEGFYVYALHLKAMRSLMQLLEEAHRPPRPCVFLTSSDRLNQSFNST